MAEAQRMGADGLLAEDGLHRTGASLASGQALPYASPAAPMAPDAAGAVEESINGGEPVLTADELRALLQEQPSMPPSGGNEP
jgi:hypothetical protein